MDRRLYILDSKAKRSGVAQIVAALPKGSRVEIKPPTRTLGQNDLLHKLCTTVSEQIEWNGKKRDVEAWKDIFTAALLSATHELDVVPGINGGFVLLGLHTSSLGKERCSDLIELIYAFGAERGVDFDGSRGAAGGETNPAACAA